jgi:hypothetical protein
MSKSRKARILDAATRAHEYLRNGPPKFSGEGYVGGYSAALSDVVLALNGVRPNHHQGGEWDFWKDWKDDSR